MRQVLLLVPRGRGGEALAIARRFGAMNVASLAADGDEGPRDMVVVHLPNTRVGEAIEALQAIDDMHATITPQAVMPLRPPANAAPDQVKDVGRLSALEVFLAGLQSIGSWRGYIGLAAASGVVVWIGLLTNTIFLLTAAMLVAPFASPAMNLAIGTARGDFVLMRQALMRYVAGLATGVAVAWLLTFVYGMRTLTTEMVNASLISDMAVLLPLVAGAAGAWTQLQSERDSLVSGAAVGVLVAASLAPPMGALGAALALADWDVVLAGLFQLMLQLVAINVSAAVVFRFFGLRPDGPRYPRGRASLTYASGALTLLALGGLMFWQFSGRPELLHAADARRAEAEVREVVKDFERARPIEVRTRYTRAEVPGAQPLLVEALVMPSVAETDGLAAELTQRIHARLAGRYGNTLPLVSVTLLERPPGSAVE